jgi:peptidoglycan/xylan/chitin deacetylase (PgdA/CDA1 family)
MESEEIGRRAAIGLGISGAASLLFPRVAGAAPQAPVAHAMPTIYRRGNTSRKQVALTFDAGADVGNAAGILDLLHANNITASFGMTGRWAEQNPAVAQRVIADGHQLINHTMTHRSFTYGGPGRRQLTRAERWQQIDDAEATYHRVMGVGSNGWFRPPYMAWSTTCAWDCADHGWTKIAMQTVDSGGWKGGPWQIVQYRCIRMAVNGAIYVFHVGRGSTDFKALPGIITALQHAGYGFASVEDIVRP